MPGINVGRVGLTFAPSDLESSGAKGIRCTYHPATPVAFGRAWLEEIRLRGMSVLMLLDNDTHWWDAPEQWRDGVARARDAYGDLVDAWQVCNEPDAGWYPGTTETIEQRAAAHPSSWVMTQSELVDRLGVAREVLGDRVVMIGPGLVSGHPEWAADADWLSVDMLACHPYAKSPGEPELLALLSAYAAFGLPVVVSEYDATTEGMHRWMAKNQSAAFAFCWSDAMVPGFGLIERPERYVEFVEANAMEEPEEPVGMNDDQAMDAALKDLWTASSREIAVEDYNPDQMSITRYWKTHVGEMGTPVGGEYHADSGNAYCAFTRGVWRWLADGSDTVEKVA